MPSSRSSESHNQSAEHERLKLSARRTLGRIMRLLEKLNKLEPRVADYIRRNSLRDLPITIRQLQTSIPPRYQEATKLVHDKHKFVKGCYVNAVAATGIRRRRGRDVDTGNSMDAKPSGTADDGETVDTDSMEVEDNAEDLVGLFGNLEVNEQDKDAALSGVVSESMELE